MAFGLGIYLRSGEHKELGSNDTLASQQCFVQYVYETTLAPSWAPKGTYIVVGNKELLADESHNEGVVRRGHMDVLGNQIEAAIRGIPKFFFCVFHCYINRTIYS